VDDELLLRWHCRCSCVRYLQAVDVGVGFGGDETGCGGCLALAVDARKLVGQAMGILMERFDVDDDRAFAMLRRHPKDTNTKLRDVAQHLIDTRNQNTTAEFAALAQERASPIDSDACASSPLPAGRPVQHRARIWRSRGHRTKSSTIRK
jgi:hypothetical protein